MTTQVLEPRDGPWKRGDVCTKDEAVGFVLSNTSDCLEILWHGRDGIDRVDKVPATETAAIARVARADDISPRSDQTNLERLDVIQSLEFIQNAIANRTFKSDIEKGSGRSD